jgi:NADPH-ferrihemoprotein reductase
LIYSNITFPNYNNDEFIPPIPHIFDYGKTITPKSKQKCVANMSTIYQVDVISHRQLFTDTRSFTAFITFGIATLVYLLRHKLWREKPNSAKPYGFRRKMEEGDTRDIVQKMKNAGKNCIIFFGSQSGIAEDIAARLAKEGHSRYGLQTMVCNLEDYDYDNLCNFPSDAVAMFVISTFGEGEPPDNAQDFYNLINDDSVSFSSGDSSLSNLNFVSFGLGNSTYEHFNAASERIDKSLERLGGHRIGVAGRGDDGEKTTEEDFLAWKEPMWAALADKMGLEERESCYEPVFGVVERPDLSNKDERVYLGEPNQARLKGMIRAPFNSHNPFVGPVVSSRDLFKDEGRSCLHLEIDLANSGLTYETGDHATVFPVNSDIEVDRFLRIFGLYEKRHTVVDLKALDRTAKVAFPTPTTYDTIARYKLEICAPVSRQLVQQLVAFAPNSQAKAELVKLGTEKDYFHQQITDRRMNLGQTLQRCGGEAVWSDVPFSMLVESIIPLQPRHFSISSSAMVAKDRLTITAKVESESIADSGFEFHGVASNYLFAVQQAQSKARKLGSCSIATDIHGPRGQYEGFKIPFYIRRSTYRLPSDPALPIIMVGPGTGVAPFRGFVQERAAQKKAGLAVGPTLLFYGCRDKSKDMIYEEDWKVS